MKKHSNEENKTKLISHDHDIDQIREKLQKTSILDQSEGPDAKKITKIDANVKLFEFLVYYVNEYADDNNPIVEMYEPSVYLYGLTIPDLEGLLAEIRVHTELKEQERKERDYGIK